MFPEDFAIAVSAADGLQTGGDFRPHARDLHVPEVISCESAGKVQWDNGALAGNYFGNAYTKVTDPQCGKIAASLQAICTLTAIANSSGNIVLPNPSPGTRGNLGQNSIEYPGQWSLNTSMSKSFKLREKLNLRFRADATNILNHPTPANPDLNINSSVTFGNIATKTGNRILQAMMRVEF